LGFFIFDIIKMMEEEFKNFQSIVSFLDSILDKMTSYAQHMDNQIQILVGISSAVFVFSATQFSEKRELFLLVLALFSISSAIVALFAIHPPGFMRKRGQPESLMYNKKIISFSSAKNYGEEILKVVKDPNEILQQYATEIYNLSRYYYRPKRTLFHFARSIFLLGFIFSFLFFLFGRF
jgi:hypothetical protein